MRCLGLSFWTLTLLGACAGSTPDGRPPPFSSEAVVDRKVLTGPDGIRVRLVQTDDAALVELARVREALDGAVLLTELGGSPAERTFETELNGRGARLLVRKDRAWTLTLGGPVRLEVDEAASAGLDPSTLIDEHLRQRAKGRLSALSRFDADGARRAADEGLTEAMARLEEPCGFVPKTKIDFEGLAESDLARWSIASFCDSPRSAIARACAVPELKEAMKTAISSVECRFGDALGLEVEGDTLRYTVHFETANQDQRAREAFDQLSLLEGRTVRQVRLDAETVVCAEPGGSSRIVVRPAEDKESAGVAFGSGDELVLTPASWGLSQGWFFEPRYPNPSHNSAFRGYDLRYYSYIGVDEKSRCQLRCGPREIQLEELAGDDKRALLESVRIVPRPDPRVAHALARDKKGVYFYVDRGATEATEKDFRLYVGPPGRVRLQKMRDIVTDTEGQIFSSVRGRLKLFLGRNDAEWQAGRTVQKLTRVDPAENLDLIYGRLGVYLGQPLHTPCDRL